MAHQLKARVASNQITQIRDELGSLTLWATTGPQTQHTRSCTSLRPRVTGVLWRPTHVDPRHFKPSRVALCPFPPSQFTSNPVVIGTLKIWAQVRRHFGWLTLPQATPVCNNHLFLPATIDPRFSYLEREGLRCIGELYIDSLFASFDQLRVAFNLRGSDFFRYFQLRDFVKTHSPQSLLPSGADLVLKARTLSRRHVSYFYDLFSPVDESAINKIRTNWEKELQFTFSDDFWKEALRAVNSSSSCARLSLIQFKGPMSCFSGNYPSPCVL